MLRAILTIVELWLAGNRAAEGKRAVAWAGVAAIIAFAGAIVANLGVAAAVFLAVQPALAPPWAALAAAGAAAALAGLLVGAIAWQGARARDRKARNAALAGNSGAKAENAILIGTLAAAFLSGIASGADRRQSAPSCARD